MKTLKKGFKYIFRSLIALVLFIGIYLLIAYSCQYITTNDTYQKPIGGTEVFLISNGVHTDICLPISENNNFWKAYFNPNQFKGLKTPPKYIAMEIKSASTRAPAASPRPPTRNP